MRFNHYPRRVLRRVEKPSRYVGGEWNSCYKDELMADGKERIHFAFCFPDIYEVGMSNLALRIIYSLLNEEEDIYCERVFAPAEDMSQIMDEENLSMHSVETGRELKDFDIVGVTLQYELSYPTVLDLLDRGGIALYSHERGESDPFVCAGGPVVYNPEPVADFFDFIMIGEGEELLLEVMEAYREWKANAEPRKAYLQRLAKIEGVYVPSLYQAFYDAEGKFEKLEPIPGSNAPKMVRKRIIKDLDQAFVPLKVLVPNMEIVHDRIFLELYRGCANGCRFCQAGMIYRPVRERTSETLLKQAETMIRNSGYEEIGLLSLSSGDYSELEDLSFKLVEHCEENHINLSLPSLRLDSVSMELLDKVSRTRKSGLTFAPEAGSQTMRDRINKNIQEDNLLETARMAFEMGWDRLKLYFILGLPGESDEDVLGIADLCQKLFRLRDEVVGQDRRRRLQITVSTSFFIPKPWTPFQWQGQITKEEMKRKRDLLANALRDRRISYDWHEFVECEVETILARGDRRLSKVLEAVYRAGGRMESERHGFSYERWTKAMEEAGLSIEDLVTRQWDYAEPLPWDFIDCGVKKEFLIREMKRALDGDVTPDCRQACSACGVMGFEAGICPRHEA